MANLYCTTYYLRKALAYHADYYFADDKFPETLDRPEHFLYGTWDCIARDFNPYDQKDWKKIAHALGKFVYSLLFSAIYVDPNHKTYSYPKHLIGAPSITVYWLRDEYGNTIPIANIRKWYQTERDAKWQDVYDAHVASNQMIPYRYYLRRPKTRSITRRDLTEEEYREYKDAYRLNLPRLKAPVTYYDDNEIYTSRCWKDNRKDKRQYQHRKQTKRCPRF